MNSSWGFLWTGVDLCVLAEKSVVDGCLQVDFDHGISGRLGLDLCCMALFMGCGSTLPKTSRLHGLEEPRGALRWIAEPEEASAFHSEMYVRVDFKDSGQTYVMFDLILYPSVASDIHLYGIINSIAIAGKKNHRNEQ